MVVPRFVESQQQYSWLIGNWYCRAHTVGERMRKRDGGEKEEEKKNKKKKIMMMMMRRRRRRRRKTRAADGQRN